MRKDAFVPTHPFVLETMAHAPAGLTVWDVSEKAGLSHDWLYRLDRRRNGVNLSSVRKLAAFLKVDPQILLDKLDDETVKADKGHPQQRKAERTRLPDIPILGLAAGSAIGSFQMLPSVLGYVARPPALAFVDDAYALYVENESMAPMFGPGGLIFAHPHKPTKKDDAVIIQVKKPDGTTESFIKILVRRTAEWIIARQLNPEAEIRFKADTVTAVHKVPDLAELFNA